MGLDMFLTKRTYVKNWDYMKPEEIHKITVTRNGKLTHIKSERVSEIIEEIGYWREATAIHNWFVENIQDGYDGCQKSIVPRDKLMELRRLVIQVLADPSEADALLPLSTGFLSSSTEYDKYYFEDLELTKGIIERALEDREGEFYYQSSW